MNQPTVVYPPNRPLERVLTPSKTPVSYDYLYFVDINEKGELIVGSSNVNGAYWEGTLYHYKNGAAAITEQYSSYYISASSIADAKFIKNSNRVVTAEDSGHLRVLAINDGEPKIKWKDFFITDARIEQLATWNTGHKVLSCGDTSITLWDVENTNTNPVEEFKDYHTELVTSVDVNKNEYNIFASASIDRRACIWDDRLKMPATVLYQNEFSALTSIVWNPAQPEYVVVGSQGGDIYNMDIRQPKDFVDFYHCFDAYVNRAAFSNSGNLAVCGDTSTILVLNNKDNFKIIYTNNDHSAYVRGVAWFEETMYSCGFDKKIIKHVF